MGSSADAEFNKVLRKTVGFSVKNAFRSLGKGYLPFLRESESALPEVRKYEKRVNSISAKLAPLADLSLAVLGGDLKKAELLSARLGDVQKRRGTRRRKKQTKKTKRKRRWK